MIPAIIVLWLLVAHIGVFFTVVKNHRGEITNSNTGRAVLLWLLLCPLAIWLHSIDWLAKKYVEHKVETEEGG